MRKDMSKVLVERSRVGGKYSRVRKTRKGDDYEKAPKKEGMKRRYSDTKSLNENLRPLERYLRSKIGRSWDRTFSEICENIKLSSAVQRHIREHIPDFVRTNIFEQKDGKITRIYRTAFSSAWLELRRDEMYVDKRGILRAYRYGDTRNEWKKAWRKKYTARWKTEFLNDLEPMFSGPIHIEHDGTIYKVSTDRVTQKEVHHKLIATYATADFNTAVFRRGFAGIEKFFATYQAFGKSTHPYWVRYRELLAKARSTQKERKRAEIEKGINL